MGIAKSSLWNAVAISIKMLALLVLNKLLAVFVGPNGYAAIAQIQNIISISISLGNAGFNSGIVKYTSEYEMQDRLRLDIWKTAFLFSIFSTVLVSVGIYTLSDFLSEKYLMDKSYSKSLKYLAFFVGFIVFNNIFISIINGYKNVLDYVKVNIFSSVFSLLYTAVLIYLFGLEGALFALVSNQAIVCVFSFYVGWNRRYFSLEQLIGKGSIDALRKLSNFSLMILIPSILWPIIYTYVRQTIVNDSDAAHAGYWDAMHRLSNVYLTFITAVISVYALPKISSLNNYKEINFEIRQIYKLVIPFALLLCLFIFLFREFIVLFLFSSDFYPMVELFKWQVLGDFIKVIAWVMSYTFMARAMAYRFITVELISIISYFFIVDYYINEFGFVGVSVAHFYNNLLFLLLSCAVYYFTFRVSK